MTKKALLRMPKTAGIIGSGLVLATSAAWLPIFEGVASAGAPATHEIATCAQLKAIDDDYGTIADNFKLTANIDCSGGNFEPLKWIDADEQAQPFAGTLDGQGYSISGINVASNDDAGLFYETSGATFKNLKVSGMVSTSDGYAGGLAAGATDTTVENVIMNVNVTTYQGEAGGLFGDYQVLNDGGHIIRAESHGNVSGSRYVGGLIGYVYSIEHDTVIEQSSATGNVTADDADAGGLIGQVESYSNEQVSSLTIQDVYATGNVTAPNVYVGGLIGSANTVDYDGLNVDLTIKRAYATGTVSAEDYMSGLIGTAGHNDHDGTFHLTDVFTASDVNTNSSGSPLHISAIIGSDEHSTIASGIYFDASRVGLAGNRCSEISNLSDCHPVNVSNATPNYFFNGHSNAPLNTWDFNDVWVTHSDTYPTFKPLPYNWHDGGQDQSGSDNDSQGQDSDGIADAIEDGAPNNGDGNADGTRDSQQPNVASLVNPVTGKYVTLAVDSTCSISSVQGKDANRNLVKDGGFSYPYGMLDFSVNCGTPGYTATVHHFYYGASNSTYSVRKYTKGAYATIPGASYSTMTNGGQNAVKATYQVTDGSGFDDDGTVNGVIVDPAGLGQLTTGAPDTGFAPTSNTTARTFLGL